MIFQTKTKTPVTPITEIESSSFCQEENDLKSKPLVEETKSNLKESQATETTAKENAPTAPDTANSDNKYPHLTTRGIPQSQEDHMATTDPDSWFVLIICAFLIVSA